jgi:transcriptional regulator with XRE-family HTH domain
VKADPQGLGVLIERARERAGKSKGQVCREMGVDRAYLNRAIKGEFKLGADKLVALADATGVTVDFLLGRDGADEMREADRPAGVAEVERHGSDGFRGELLDTFRRVERRDRKVAAALFAIMQAATRTHVMDWAIHGLLTLVRVPRPPAGPEEASSGAADPVPLGRSRG